MASEAPARWASSSPCSRSRSPVTIDRLACSAASVFSTSLREERSSASSSVSSLIWALRRVSTVSRLLTSRLRKNCAIMNSEVRKMKTSSSVARASTKPGH